MTQKEVVYELVRKAGKTGLPTFKVNEVGIGNYITSPDRLLRKLQKEGRIIGLTLGGKRYKTWFDSQYYNNGEAMFI